MQTQMDLDKIPTMIGDIARERFQEASALLENTTWPIYFVGPSGSGKSLMAMNLAKYYAKKHEVPAYYVQLSPDQTKTTVIGGYRLVNGTLQVVRGTLARAMTEGAVIVVDEATHTTQEMLLMFNSIMDRTSLTYIGDELVYSDSRFRMIFCSNDALYAGNVRLPQSFAQRLVTFFFDYPSQEDEQKIARKIAKEEYAGDMDVPDSVIRYITAYIREVRTPYFPLSARNVAISLIRLAVIAHGKKMGEISEYFTKAQNAEATRRLIAKRILGREPGSSKELVTGEVDHFVKYVSAIGAKKFCDIIMSACMFHLDVDGAELNRDSLQTKLASMII